MNKCYKIKLCLLNYYKDYYDQEFPFTGPIRTSHIWSKGQLGSSLFKQYPAAGLLAKDKTMTVAPIRREMSAGGDHVKLWTAERLLSVGLLGLIPAAFISPSPIMDYLLAVSLVMHSHW